MSSQFHIPLPSPVSSKQCLLKFGSTYADSYIMALAGDGRVKVKKKYEPPQLKTYGCVEDLTHMKEGYEGGSSSHSSSRLVKLIELPKFYR